MPHAQTGHLHPRGSVTSGRKIPAPPSSNHFPFHLTSISKLGGLLHVATLAGLKCRYDAELQALGMF